MIGRKILFLAAGYVAGNVVASVYSSGKKQKGQKDVKYVVEGFLETQKKFLTDMEQKCLSEENQKELSKQKKDFLRCIKKYSQEGQKFLEDVSKTESFIEGKKKARSFLGDQLQRGKNFLDEMRKEVQKEEQQNQKK